MTDRNKIGGKGGSESDNNVSSKSSTQGSKVRGGIKIKVGMSSQASTGTHTHQESAQSIPAHAALELMGSNSSIYELCAVIDRRRGKRKRIATDQSKALSTKEKAKQAASKSRASKDVTNTHEKASGPQVEIVNGQIVIRESSLTVPALGTASHEDFEEVEEGIHPTATYSSFAPNSRSAVWGIDETKRFYETLRQCGTDFSLMQAFFPRRTRKQLKNKFFREEKQHPELIKAALNLQLPLDMTPFEVHLGKINVVDAKQHGDKAENGGLSEEETESGNSTGEIRRNGSSGQAAQQLHQQEMFLTGIDENAIVDV